MSDNETEDIDELLSELNQREEMNQQKCFRRSAVRIAQEIRRRAKAQQRLLPYMHACFRVMVNSSSLFDAAAGRDASIELIRLLESPDQARRIEPDLVESDYENAIHWMSSCAYDNLADNTAELLGYNSEGMHQCINDGIQVCRRTGKLQCVSCFREYAAHVYSAADDMDMAVHFARQAVDNPNPASEGRRWASSHTLTRMLLRSGNLPAAMESLQRGWQLVGTYHSPLEAQHKTFELYSEIMALMGQTPDPQMAPRETPPRDEYPYLYLVKDYVAAVGECMSGDYQSAVTRLTEWDTLLQSRQQLSNWFQTRLRVLCALRMAGDTRRLQTLSQELEKAARAARDWYTLRCLNQINDPDQPAAPVPTLKPFTVGPLAQTRTSHSGSAPAVLTDAASATTSATPDPAAAKDDNTAADAASSSAPAADAAATDSGGQGAEVPADLESLAMVILTMAQQQQYGMELEAQAVAQARSGLMSADVDSTSPPHRVHWLLHLMTFLPSSPDEASDTWQWAQRLAALRPDDAVSLNILATIATRLFLRGEAGFGDAPVSKEQITDMYRRSLDWDASRASNFERAGEYFAHIGDESEAERCFARAFRLDRSRSSAALSLSDIYARSERPADALEVLDLYLREGGSDARAAWQAAMVSSYLQKYEATLTYLKRFAEDVPDHVWMHFYRAQAFLALNRADDALEAAQLFAQGEPERQFLIKLLLCAATGLKRQSAETISALDQFLSEKLASVDYMTSQALARLFDFLWTACAWLDDSEPAKQRLVQLLVTSGMTPERYFEAARLARPKEEGISFYIVALGQSLPNNWAESPACGPGQQEWGQYAIRYGVLSTSQAKAERMAVDLQAQSGLPRASLLDVQAFDQEYLDSPGIVWQSLPEPIT